MTYKFVQQADGSVLFYKRENSIDTLIQSVQNGEYEIQNTSSGLRIASKDNAKELLFGKQLSDFIDVNNNPFATIEDLVSYYASFFVNAPKPLGAISTEVYSWRQLHDAVEVNGVQVITLDQPRAYIFHQVDLEGRVIVCNNPNLTIIGFSSESSYCKSTGKPAQDNLLQDAPMITFLQTCAVRWISFVDSDYPVLKDAPSGAFDWFGVNTLNCQKGFVIKNALFDVYTGCGVLDGGSWQLDGNINSLVLRDCIVRGNTQENANLIDITANAVVTGRIRFEGTPFLTALASQKGIFVDSAAIFPSILATSNYPFQLENCRFGTNGTALVGRVAGDGFTLIKECSPLLDSKPNGQAYFQNNGLSTVINNIGVLVPINANFILNPEHSRVYINSRRKFTI